MSEMVERVAREMAKIRGVDPDYSYPSNSFFDDHRPETETAVPAWQWYQKAAQAAIAVMREPTEAMCNLDVIKIATKETELPDRLEIRLRAIWQNMIDEALK